MTGLTEDLALVHNALKLAPFFVARVIEVRSRLNENLCVFPLREHSNSCMVHGGLLLLDAKYFLKIRSEGRAVLILPYKSLVFTGEGSSWLRDMPLSRSLKFRELELR